MRGRKMRPAPVEDQVKRAWTWRGRTASQDVRRVDWTRVQKREARRRREVRRVRSGAGVGGCLVVGKMKDGCDDADESAVLGGVGSVGFGW